MDDKLRELLMNDKPVESTEKKPFFDGYKPNFYFKNKPEPVRLYIPRQNGYSTTKENIYNIKNILGGKE